MNIDTIDTIPISEWDKSKKLLRKVFPTLYPTELADLMDL
jgi:hypothetical protein